jgi:hypothetical protein
MYVYAVTRMLKIPAESVIFYHVVVYCLSLLSSDEGKQICVKLILVDNR